MNLTVRDKEIIKAHLAPDEAGELRLVAVKVMDDRGNGLIPAKGLK